MTHVCEILLIQGDGRARNALAGLLRDEGHQVRELESINDVKGAIVTEACSVLFDVGAGGKHGLTIVQRLVADNPTASFALIAMSAIRAHASAGVSNVLVMPFTAFELNRTLAAACRNKRRRA